jgi:ethanolamine utilization microcompartment shell protein EutL
MSQQAPAWFAEFLKRLVDALDRQATDTYANENENADAISSAISATRQAIEEAARAALEGRSG